MNINGKNLEIVLIAAVAKNNVIGDKGKIPWRIKEDIKRFKKLTFGNSVLMGKDTYFSIRDEFRPLEGRANIVLTGNKDIAEMIKREGAIHSYSVQEAMKIASKLNDSVYVIGGQRVYEDTINLASKLEITEIDKEYNGDAFFPKFDKKEWKKIYKDKKLRARLNS